MQSPGQMISKPMIKEEVGLGLTVRGVNEEETGRRVDEALKICGLYPFRNWPVGALSFGQKKRVTIASILVMQPEIMILDEPTAGQDYRHYTEIMEFLKKLNEELGLTIIMITHDMHLVFLVTTDPSELAASINKIGVPYSFAYALAIALRYIPDIQDDFVRIKNAQAARGIEMSAKAGLVSRIKNVAAIIFPLLFSTMERIDVVSNAMELRGFGKKKGRTWYSYRRLSRNDHIVLILTVIFVIAAMAVTYADGSRF